MDIDVENNKVVINDKKYKLDSIIKILTQLSGEQVYHFLSNRGTQLPRRVNCLALMSVLNHRIKFLNSNSLSKDYFLRLQYYKYFTEQQLYNLFKKICNDEESFFAYRYNFFKLLLINYVGMDLDDTEIVYLKNVKKGNMESFDQYYNYISGAALEQENTFDGQIIDDLKIYLEKSSSNQEIFDLAGKYGIDLPAKLRKEDFLEFILDYMIENKMYNDEIADELRKMTIAQLTTYARRVGIPMQPSMGKQELITYLFYYLSKCHIEQTSLKRIEIPNDYLPLDFSIDFALINNFTDLEPKKVIHYKNEEKDIENYNQSLIDSTMPLNEEDIELNEIIEEEVEPIEIVEEEVEPIEIVEEVETTEMVEEVEPIEIVEEEVEPIEIVEEVETTEIVEEVETTEIVEEVETTEMVEEVETTEMVEEVETTEIVEEVETTEIVEEVETTEMVEEVETTEMVEEENNLFVFDSLQKNELYGSESILKLKKGNIGLIFLIIGCSIALAIIVFCAWALLK
ncbi:MAG: hypothetical protein ACI35S_05090 [Anaeroplasma sp.]